jgi:ribonuclease BN (tRNA processing enzyme)
LKRLRIDPGRIDFVALSHLHGDHFGGVPFLFMEYRYAAPRERPLAIYGPPGTAARTQRLFEALYEKTALEAMSFPLTYEELAPGTAHTVADVRILPFAVPHVSELCCLGYRLEADGRAIAYSGDSAWSDDFITYARGADLFLCECSTFETQVPIHISYREIARYARDIDCRRIVLTHLGAEPLRRQREISLECARDGMTLELAGTRQVSRRARSVAPRSGVRRPPKGASRGRARRAR